MRLMLAALAVSVAALASVGGASAGQARASGDVPVRLGPGGGYPVIDHLIDGEYYEVEDCTRQSRWCFVSDDGEDLGWVRGSSIVGSGAKNRVTPFEFLVTPRFPL